MVLVDGLLATNYQEFVRPLQLFAIIIILLFFLRVARAAIVESKAPIREKKAKREKRQPKVKAPKWLYLEVKAPEDAAGERFPITTELTVGRSASCDVNLGYDQYASTRHARFFRQDDDLIVEDLGSTNGVWIDDERIEAPTVIRRGDAIRIGETLFEVTR